MLRLRAPLLLSVIFLTACPPPDDGKSGDDTVDTDTDVVDTDVVDTDRPSDAWGPASDTPALDGATLLTEEEVDSLQGASFGITPEDKEAGRIAEDARLAADEADIRAWILDHGMEDSVLARMLDEQPATGGDLTLLFDGNLQLVVRDPRSQDVINEVVTLGRRELVGGYKRVIDRLADPQNHVDAYLDLRDHLPAAVLDLVPTPEEVELFTDADKLEVNSYLVEYYGRIIAAIVDPGGRPPANRPDACADELGAGANSDRTMGAADASSFSAQGLYDNWVWPLKWYATCVKDQANRGTCGSFGITAAMETAVALRDDTWVNLSEQDLYFHVRGDWNPSSYGDGINTHAAWQDMLTHDYIQPFEEGWPYNPSRSRMANDTTQTYSNSCTGYQFLNPPAGPIPNYCSDTVHQGGSFCVNVFFWQYCGWFTPVPEGNTTGYKPLSEAELWDAGNKDFSLALTQIALAIERPLVLWAFVTPSFDGVSTDGWVTYAGSGEGNRGSHIYQITGFISNEVLAGVMPNAPAGAGGGYIIAKNSWGDAWADAGYAYLPYDWVKDYAISVTILHGVE